MYQNVPKELKNISILLHEISNLIAKNATYQFIKQYNIMKRKILFLLATMLISATSTFAQSDRYRWGVWGLERGDFDDAIAHFKIGADAGYRDCKGALANMYAAGMGTAKNPAKAYSYLKEADFVDPEFWIFFHMGIDLSEVITVRNYAFYYVYMSSGFTEIPKYAEFIRSGKYNCRSFGVTPNMAVAVKHMKKAYQDGGGIDGFLDCKSDYRIRRTFEEKLFTKLYDYAKKTNDNELLNILGSNNDIIKHDNDSTNYINTPKEIAALKSFIENAKTYKWKKKARETISELEAKALAEKKEKDYQALFGETEVNNDDLALFIKEYGTDYKDIAQYDKIAVKKLLINYFAAIDGKDKSAATEAYNQIYTYFKNSGRQSSAIALVSAYDFRQGKYGNNILEIGAETYAQNITNAYQGEANFAKNYDITREVNHEKIKEEAQQLYNNALSSHAVSLASTWTAETEMTDMNKTVEMTNNEEDKKSVMEYYNKVASQKIEALNQHMLIDELESIYALSYMDDALMKEAKKKVDKFSNKQNPFFRWGVEGDLGITGSMNTFEYGGGASIVLGRRSQMLNFYIGGQYAGYDGSTGAYGSGLAEDNHTEASAPSHYANYTKVQIPVELRFNYFRNAYGCMYIGGGAVYNMNLKGKIAYYPGDQDGEDLKKDPIELSDGLNGSNLAARVSLGMTMLGIDLAVYVNYNLTSPFNTAATTNNFSAYEGYIHTQLEKKITTGLRLGIYF